MATNKQIAANRRNARNSTGPRTAAGRKRARRNSYRHGLAAAAVSSAERTTFVETLARAIAGDSTDAITLEYARSAAHAEFDLANIRRIKVALINRFLMFGALDVPQLVYPGRVPWQLLEAMIATGVYPMPFDAASTMPPTEAERTAEAVRRALPELLKLDRYERRAATRRRRSLVHLRTKYR